MSAPRQMRGAWSRRLLLTGMLVAVAQTAVGPALAQFSAAASAAPKSALPLPMGAELWVDQAGRPTDTIAGVPTGAIERMRVLAFRPKTAMNVEQFAALCVAQGLLPGGQPAVLNSSEPPKGEAQNQEDVYTFPTGQADQWLVLGFIRNLRTQNQLAYAVMVDGQVTAPQALAQSRALLTVLAENARQQRITPTPPAGATSSDASRRFVGPALGQMLQGIRRDPLVNPQVKAMAGAVIPQASSVTLHKWRTVAPLGDEAFFDFYTGQASRMGWGLPISRDARQPGRPTLLFQLPDGAGVVMVRAQATPIVGPGAAPRPATILYVLVIEGRIDVSALTAR